MRTGHPLNQVKYHTQLVNDSVPVPLVVNFTLINGICSTLKAEATKCPGKTVSEEKKIVAHGLVPTTLI